MHIFVDSKAPWDHIGATPRNSQSFPSDRDLADVTAFLENPAR